MSKIYNISIVLSFVALWVNSTFNYTFEITLGFILIFSFGILHGSNDILLLDQLSNKKKSFLKIISLYIVTVLSVILLFNFIPIIGLSLFVIFSGYHFGQQHWEHKKIYAKQSILKLLYFIYGMLILQMLFMSNTVEVISVIFSITGKTITYDLLLFTTLVVGLAYIGICIYITIRSEIFRSVVLIETFYLMLFFIIFKVSSLIWGFAIYFIFWHSIPSLYEQITFLYKDFSATSILKYFKNALPYWLISIIGVGIVYNFISEDHYFYPVFFSFIAAVTFPHTFVINKLFKTKKTQPN